MVTNVTADVAAYDSHAIGGECASLVRADCGRVAHCLTGIQVSDQVVIGHHSLQRPHTQAHGDNNLMPMTHQPKTGSGYIGAINSTPDSGVCVMQPGNTFTGVE